MKSLRRRDRLKWSQKTMKPRFQQTMALWKRTRKRLLHWLEFLPCRLHACLVGTGTTSWRLASCTWQLCKISKSSELRSSVWSANRSVICSPDSHLHSLIAFSNSHKNFSHPGKEHEGGCNL